LITSTTAGSSNVEISPKLETSPSAILRKIKELIENVDNKCYISIASIWEMAIKVSQNKLALQMTFEELYQILMDNDIEILPITYPHIQVLLTLPYYHRDPFDRIIISQGIAENINIFSKDEYFSLYPISLVWKQ
jgi:PIN domain nuclease of toxin-antitoxin system